MVKPGMKSCCPGQTSASQHFRPRARGWRSGSGSSEAAIAAGLEPTLRIVLESDTWTRTIGRDHRAIDSPVGFVGRRRLHAHERAPQHAAAALRAEQQLEAARRVGRNERLRQLGQGDHLGQGALPNVGSVSPHVAVGAALSPPLTLESGAGQERHYTEPS